MNILFLSISAMPHLSNHSISLDLIREMKKNGHDIYVLCASDNNEKTSLLIEESCTILRVKIGKNKKANLIEKGLTTIFLPYKYINAIKKYYSDVKFDLVLYPTPPITQVETVRFLKKRDGAKSYLLLKDIFPQNAVDIGMMSKDGIKGLIYKYFRSKEKKLYSISDRIGCMSQANVDYILRHNPEIDAEKVEICPNSIEIIDKRINQKAREDIRKKYNIPLEKKVFIYGGNLGKPQGIPFIIECLKSVRGIEEAYFLIVGDGTEYKRLEIYCNESNQSNVKLMKKLPKEDYDQMVASCDVGLIFLDYRFTIPNFPSRLLGYLQAGIPVLACTDPNTDIGKVIVDRQFGWWCESNEANDFKVCVEEVLKSDLHILRGNAYQCLNTYYNISDACFTILRL